MSQIESQITSIHRIGSVSIATPSDLKLKRRNDAERAILLCRDHKHWNRDGIVSVLAQHLSDAGLIEKQITDILQQTIVPEWMGTTTEILRRGKRTIAGINCTELLTKSFTETVGDKMYFFSCIRPYIHGAIYFNIAGRGDIDRFQSICDSIVGSA
jgi:hypothetical protein